MERESYARRCARTVSVRGRHCTRARLRPRAASSYGPGDASELRGSKETSVNSGSQSEDCNSTKVRFNELRRGEASKFGVLRARTSCFRGGDRSGTSMRTSALLLLLLPLCTAFAPAAGRSPPALPIGATRRRHQIVPAAAADFRPGAATPWGEKALSWQIVLSGLVSGLVLNQLRHSSASKLLTLHVSCLAALPPLGTAAISTVRQRKLPSAAKLPGDLRKRRLEWLVIRHFLTSAAALYAATVGIVAIWLQKGAAGRPHLSTSHGRVGGLAFALWVATYLSAQPHVWRDQWRARRFSLFSNKRWLWPSPTHRWLGTAAFAASSLAFASGMRGWRVLDGRVVTACCVGTAAATASIVGASQDVRAQVRRVARAARNDRER